ncbi:MAG: YihY/virulence factor BrkB family protein, partial [Methylophilus sp.]
MNFFKPVIKVFADSVMSWIDHRAASKGAALAFYALFSFAPILILTIAVAGFFFGSAAIEGQFFYPLQSLVGSNGALAIQAIVASASDPIEGWLATLVAVVLLFIGATSVFTELKGSLDELWGVQKSKLSPMSILLRTRLLSFGLVAVLAFLLLISLAVNSLLTLLEQYAGGIWSSSAFLFTILSSFISFTV